MSTRKKVCCRLPSHEDSLKHTRLRGDWHRTVFKRARCSWRDSGAGAGLEPDGKPCDTSGVHAPRCDTEQPAQERPQEQRSRHAIPRRVKKQFYHSGLNCCGSVIRTRASIDEDSLAYYRPLKTRSPTPLHYPLELVWAVRTQPTTVWSNTNLTPVLGYCLTDLTPAPI